MSVESSPTDRQLIEQCVAGALESYGFRWVGKKWQLKGDGTLIVLDIQPSEYSGRVYLHLGIFIDAVGTPRKPAAYRAHVSARLETLATDEAEGVFSRAMNADIPQSAESRSDAIREFLDVNLRPLVLAGRKFEDLKRSASEGALEYFLVSPEAAEILDL